MDITLYTEKAIDSSHHLNNYQGACSNIHGHTWLICIWIQGMDYDKDETGILFDFGNIKKITENLDHKYLNKDVDFFRTVNPTAENISAYILLELMHIDSTLEYRVRVYETAVQKNTYAQRQTEKFDINYL